MVTKVKGPHEIGHAEFKRVAAKWRAEREVTYWSRDLSEAALFHSGGLEGEFR